MRLTSARRLTAAAASLLLTVTGFVVLAAPGAQAATVSSTKSVPFRCATNFFNVAFDRLDPISLTVSAPESVQPGTPIPISVSFTSGPTSPPVPLTSVVAHASVTLSGKVHLGSTTVSATGQSADTSPVTVAPNSAYPVPQPVTVSMPTTSFDIGQTIDITPTTLTVNIVSGDDGIGGGIVTCTPEPAATRSIAVGMEGGANPSPQDQCTVTGVGGCLTNQNAYATILAGSLSQQAVQTGTNPNATTIDLGSMTSSTTVQTLTAPLNSITVTDTRGGNFSWSLTASMPSLTAGSKSMSNALVSITPACVATNSSSAPGAVAGGTQTFAGGVTLCTGPTEPDDTSDSTSGVWLVSGPVSLTVPAFQAAGAYSSVMNVNLA